MQFSRGQRVKHPHHGVGVFVGHVIGSSDEVAIGLGDGETSSVENVLLSDLEAVPWLGERWRFEMPRHVPHVKIGIEGVPGHEKVAIPSNGGTHVEVAVRVGTPGSRALAGRLMLRQDELTEFTVAMRSLGAVVE